LRHKREEFARRRQRPEIGDMDNLIAEVRRNFFQLLVRLTKKFLQQAKLVDQLQGGRMNCVATKIAKEVLVLFQHDDIDPRAGKQEPEHDAGRAASHYATGASFVI
jgi:hypothetical protein